ncbi:MAG: preprotein translocase subunit SecY [Planctomycetes bacterium]|nr:preprotein translocase subunit SecY [Planctomycetota bacterium]
MLDSFANIIKIKELRRKLLFTAMILVIFRFGCFVPIPGIDVQKVSETIRQYSSEEGALGKVLSLADMFTGGAIGRGALFALGIMPYITASIIFQLLVGIIPALERLQREGPTGRKKITQYTRIATVFLCIVQGGLICNGLLSQRISNPPNSFLLSDDILSGGAFLFYGIMALTCGTLLLMWLGEQIDEFGIGNGISLIIMAGIIARLPNTISYLAGDLNLGGMGASGNIELMDIFILILLFLGMVLAVVLITLGQRRVPVHQAKATRGRKVYGGARSFLPLRVNQSGVIPIIFAQSLLILPQYILSAIGGGQYFQYGGFFWMVSYVGLIVFFCYFYTAVTFNPNEMADNLKQNGSYIPGIRPGKRTADHLERIMTRIALAGAIFLSFVAVVPTFVSKAMDIPFGHASFLGGTGLLIVVGVALDVVQRVESHLLNKHYDGFVKGGKSVRGRRR